MFKDKRVSLGGPAPLPPRSPDLNPFHFFLWGTMKTMVYMNKIIDLNDYHNRIEAAAATIRRQDQLLNYTNSWIGQVILCVQQHSYNFELV